MIGYFENLPSERAILGYGLEEATPDHSSLSVIEVNASLCELVHRNTEEQWLGVC